MDFINIGYTQKPHGVKGELKINIEEPFWGDFLQKKLIFIEIKGKHTPFFVAQVRGIGVAIAKIEEINTPEDALKIASKMIFMRKTDISADALAESEETEDVLEYADLEGFMIEDKALGTVGVIEEIVEMPQQEMAIVQYRNRETMIPLNDVFIQKIDYRKKIVLLDLPEGLLNL